MENLLEENTKLKKQISALRDELEMAVNHIRAMEKSCVEYYEAINHVADKLKTFKAANRMSIFEQSLHHKLINLDYLKEIEEKISKI